MVKHAAVIQAPITLAEMTYFWEVQHGNLVVFIKKQITHTY